MNELALFAGAGGGILGGKLLGWRTVCAVEWEPYPASVLCARQNDGLLETFPIWDDVQTFDGYPWRGVVDVISGGFPCQDISAAGKGAGIDGERSGMWGEMARIIHEVRPRYVFVENSPMLTSRGLGRVLGDLASMGFDARWGVLGADSVGAPHKRDRIWIFCSHTDSKRWNERVSNWEERQVLSNQGWQTTQDKSEWDRWGNRTGKTSSYVADTSKVRGEWECCVQADGCSRSIIRENHAKDAEEPPQMGTIQDMANTTQHGIQSQPSKAGKPSQRINASSIGNPEWWATEPDVGRVADGVANRVDRLKAIGNGQVPLCAATAWRILK